MSKKFLATILAISIMIGIVPIKIVLAVDDFWVLKPTIEADDITYLGGDTCKIKVGNKFGLISSTGNTQLPIEFDSIEKCICVNGVTEFVVSKANQLSHAIYKKQGDKFVFYTETGHGGGSEMFWDLNSNRAFDGEYELMVAGGQITSFLKSIYITEKKSESGNYNEYIGDWDRISENYAFVKNNQVLTGFMFQDYKWFSYGVSAVKKDGKWGYMDNNANMAIWYQYDYADSFKYGIAPVRSGNESYFIDKQGNKVGNLTFEQTRIFDDINANAWVKKDGKWGIISTGITGKEMNIYEKSYRSYFNENIARLKEENGEYIAFKDAFMLDLDNDSIPEFFIVFAEDSYCKSYVFKYENGKVNDLSSNDSSNYSFGASVGSGTWYYDNILISNTGEAYLYRYGGNKLYDEKTLYENWYSINKLKNNSLERVKYLDLYSEYKNDEAIIVKMTTDHSNSIYEDGQGTVITKERATQLSDDFKNGLKDYIFINVEDYLWGNGVVFGNDITKYWNKQLAAQPKPYISPYKYDEANNYIEFVLPTDKLITVKDQISANKVVADVVKGLTTEQKQSATGIDKLTIFAEEAVANSASKALNDININISSDTVKELEQKAIDTATSIDDTLSANGVATQRTISKTVKIISNQNKVSINKTALSNVDAVKVQTNFASLSVGARDAVSVDIEDSGNKKVTVKFPANNTTIVKLSFPNLSGNIDYKAIVDENGKPVGGKYNPATNSIEAKIKDSGIYSVVQNEKDFADIKDKAKEMQEAIKILAAKGVINGTSETIFSPDSTISRAEIAALIVRTLSKLDPNENGNFADVSQENWYFGVAGSAKKYGIINGFPDGTFGGDIIIPKDQIIVVSARVLKNEMKYKMPLDFEKYLIYADSSEIEEWAKGDIALATMANIVLKRTDNKFVGNDEMTRGDAAIILKRLFDKIW